MQIRGECPLRFSRVFGGSKLIVFGIRNDARCRNYTLLYCVDCIRFPAPPQLLYTVMGSETIHRDGSVQVSGDAGGIAMMPIEQVVVLALEPPAELLGKIATLAETINAILEAGIPDQARPLSGERLRIVAENMS